MLSTQNKHDRDERIKFFDEGHVYEVDGDRGYTSVTTFIHKYFQEFDAKKVIKKMRNSPKWESSPYYGKTDEEIMDQWETKKINSAESGTLMHLQIENFYNEQEVQTEKISTEWEYFNNFHKDFDKIPYRTEWYVFDEESRLAGSIDMIFRAEADNDVDLIIVDWKRTLELKLGNHFQKGLQPIEHLDDCNFVHYSLQLNTYKYILEKNYGKKIRSMFLVIIHPNNQNYMMKEVLPLHKEVQLMIREKMNPGAKRLLFLRPPR